MNIGFKQSRTFDSSSFLIPLKNLEIYLSLPNELPDRH
jgi:hypothetical protein